MEFLIGLGIVVGVVVLVLFVLGVLSYLSRARGWVKNE